MQAALQCRLPRSIDGSTLIANIFGVDTKGTSKTKQSILAEPLSGVPKIRCLFCIMLVCLQLADMLTIPGKLRQACNAKFYTRPKKV